MRKLAGELGRRIQRLHWRPLELSVNATAVRFQKSLKANGYGTLQTHKNGHIDILYLVKSSDIDLWIENLVHTVTTLTEQEVFIIAILDKAPSAEELTKILSIDSNICIKLESEYELQINELNPEISKYNPARQSWIKQQVLKTIYVGTTTNPTIILDSDTYLMKNLGFQTRNTQLLLCGADFHSPYSKHLRKFLGIIPTATSFVHHCQLQYPELVREIYGQDLISGLKKWLRLGIKFAEYSAVSEFQTYGDYVLSKYPERVNLFFHKHHEISRKEIKGSIGAFLLNHKRDCDCDLLTFINK
jgi:hypothetical protein